MTPQAVSLEKAISMSSNRSVTAARYHYEHGGRKVADDYDVDGKVLGQGLCGDVILVRSKADGRRYALKSIRKTNVSPSKLAQLFAEVEIYLTLDHPNIARLHNVYETDTDISLATECCEGGELYYRLQKKGVYTDADAAEVTRQMLRAVGYLHAHRIVHRDLKLENFLYESEDEKGGSSQLKLIDFGFAKNWDPSTPMMASCGSIAYVSPDVLAGNGYDNKCDLWSIGVIVWMLMAGYPPFHGDEKWMMAKIKAGQADWSHKSRWKPVPDDAVDFIKQMLVVNPSERPDAQAALRHGWLMRTAQTAPAVLSRDALRSMKEYAVASKVKRAVLQLLAQELAPEETLELREIFLSIDQSNSGTISFRELKDAIRAAPTSPQRRRKLSVTSVSFAGASPWGAGAEGGEGSFVSEADGSTLSDAGAGSPTTPARALRRANSGMLDELLGSLDVSGEERIYYSDFLAATMGTRSRLREETARATFNRFDARSSGTISVSDFRAVLGETFEGVNVEELARQADPKNKGGVSFEDFVRVLEDRDLTPAPMPTVQVARLATASPKRLSFFPEDEEAACDPDKERGRQEKREKGDMCGFSEVKIPKIGGC